MFETTSLNSLYVENQILTLSETRQDPTDVIIIDLALFIFHQLNLVTLGTICCVSKKWYQLANDPLLWKKGIYREIAFGNDKWAQVDPDLVKKEDYSEEFSSLPWVDFIADCKKFKKIYPEKNMRKFLKLVRIPKHFTINKTNEIAKRFCSEIVNSERYRDLGLGDIFSDKSYWVIMTDILPGSFGEYPNFREKYIDQQKIIDGLGEKSLIDYEQSELREAAACIYSQLFGSNVHLFSLPNTLCKERIPPKDNLGEGRLVVGGFTKNGLTIRTDWHPCYHNSGIAILRKCFSSAMLEADHTPKL